MYEQVGKRAHSKVRMSEHLLCKRGTFCCEAAFVHQEHITLHRHFNAGLKPVQEIFK